MSLYPFLLFRVSLGQEETISIGGFNGFLSLSTKELTISSVVSLPDSPFQQRNPFSLLAQDLVELLLNATAIHTMKSCFQVE